MKKVYVSLIADLLHMGHINILKEVSKLGKVTVERLTLKACRKLNHIPYLNFEKRKEVLVSLSMVTDVIAQDTVSYKKKLEVLKLDVLKQAIIKVKEEGIEKYYERYRKYWQILVGFLRERNVKYLVEDKYYLKIITFIFILNGVNFNNMHDYFFERNFTIYPRKVADFDTCSVANIGEIDSRDMEELVTFLKRYLDA